MSDICDKDRTLGGESDAFKKHYKKAAIFSMAAVLGVAGVSGAVVIPATNTPQIAQAAVRDYQVTVKKGTSIRLSKIVPKSVLNQTDLTVILNSDNAVVSYTVIGKPSKIIDGQIKGLKKGTAKLSFFQEGDSDNEQSVFYTVTVNVIK